MEKINPTQEPYRHLSPFRFKCLTNFPFIDEDFDALTNYELLAKVVEYLNNVIANEEIVSSNVESLYSAFMELQEEVIAELKAQDKKIDDYFDDINIQTFVDHKIDEMILSGEFETLLENAIIELNPSVLNDSKRIQVVDFGVNLIDSLNRSYINSDFLSEENKAMLIDILNKMIDNDETYYYFVNPSDEFIHIYKIRLTMSSQNFWLEIHYDFTHDPINYGDTYIWTQDYNLVIEDGVITDISLGYSSGTSTYKLLKTDNESSYTPTSAYNPATKAYVDENVLKFSSMPVASSTYNGKVVQYIGESDSTYNKGYFYECVNDGSDNYSWVAISFGGGGGGSSYAYYDYFPTNVNTNIYFNYNSTTASNPLAFATTLDKENFINILNDAWSKGYTTGFLIAFHDQGGFVKLLNVDYAMFDPSNNPSTIWISSFLSFEYRASLSYGFNNDGTAVRLINVSVATNSSTLITDINSSNFVTNSSGLPLGVNNTASYTPTGQYNPATKGYVDDNTALSVYDLPQASASYDGTIAQFKGTTNLFIKKGQFVLCKYNYNNQDYVWEDLDITPYPVNYTSGLIILDSASVASNSSDPIVAYKSGNTVNIRGTIDITSTMTGTTHTAIQLPNELAPQPSVANDFEVCCNVGIRYNGSNTTAEDFCKVSIYYDSVFTRFLLNIELTTQNTSLTQDDHIRFNITYIQTQM